MQIRCRYIFRKKKMLATSFYIFYIYDMSTRSTETSILNEYSLNMFS